MPYKVQPPQDEWGYIPIPDFLGGLNEEDDSSALQDNELGRALNVVVRKGKLQKDTGCKSFGTTIVGIPQADFHFKKKNGTSELVLVTTETFYKWVPTEAQWQYVSNGTSTTANGGEASGATSITVASIAGFANGERIGIILDDGSQHQTTVNGAPAGVEIPITNAIPVGRTVPNGAAIVEATDLAGDLDFHVVGVTVPSHDYFVFTNGVDSVKRYNGTTIEQLTGIPGNMVARSLALYNNCLFAINTIEGGTATPRRVRRSNSADPTDWSTGIAGFDDLYDDEDPLIAVEHLGPYLIVYGENSVIRGEFIGTGGINYKFDTMIRHEGLTSTKGVVMVEGAHYCFMQTNFYIYRGGFDLQPIGDKIKAKLFGDQGEISPPMKHMAHAIYLKETDEVVFLYPTTIATHCNKAQRYYIPKAAWTEREFVHEVVGFGFYQAEESKPWTSLVGSWLQQTWKWNDRTLVEANPVLHLMPPSGGKVLEYDYVEPLDNGVAIPYNVETKDFISSDAVMRHDMLEMQVRGTNVQVDYSVDGGTTWSNLGTVTRTTLGRARLYLQFAFEKLRFRWSGSSNFQLKSAGFSYKLESVDGSA